jgi:hypothetical protein
MAAVVLFSLLKQIPKESSASQNPMVIVSVSVFGDTIPLMRGVQSQLLFRVNIKTKGNNYKLNATGIRLNLRSIQGGAILPLENIRVWYGSHSPGFLPVKPASELFQPETGGQWIKLSQPLQEGDNNLFVACDVSSAGPVGKFLVVAGCDEVRIGTLTYEIDRVTTASRKRVLENVPYFSTGNGDISSLASWNNHRDGSGTRPPHFNDQHSTFHIQAGHVMQNRLHSCIPALVIERNAMLNSGTSIKGNLLRVLPGGTYMQTESFSDVNSLRELIVDNGGNYLHRNEGMIGGSRKSFGTRSTVILGKYSTLTFNEKITWGNLVIDSDSSDKADFADALGDVSGDLEIRKTGLSAYLFTSKNCSVRIQGNLIVSGGSVVMAPMGNKVTLRVDGGLFIRSGMFTDLSPNQKSVRSGSLALFTGNKVYLLSGKFSLQSKESAIVTGNSDLEWKQTGCLTELAEIRVLKGCTLHVKTDTLGPVSRSHQLIINDGGVLDAGTGLITGEGGFNLSEGAVLMTSHPDGIHSDTAAGNIRTRNRLYHSDASYVYYGNTHLQKTGQFKTVPQPGTVRDFTIAKDDPRLVLLLSQPLHVTGGFYKKSGSLNRQSHAFVYLNAVSNGVLQVNRSPAH